MTETCGWEVPEIVSGGGLYFSDKLNCSNDG